MDIDRTSVDSETSHVYLYHAHVVYFA